MEKEEWKEVGIIYGIDFTGLYQVSNYGLVKSLNYRNTGREEILTPVMNMWGYLYVNLWKDGKPKRFLVHRLVAIVFNLPISDHLKQIPIEQLQVNHKDEDKTNNCVWNLEWCNSKYNNNYGTRNARVSEAHKGVPKSDETKRKIGEAMTNGKTSKSVLQLNKDTGEIIREWPSTSEVERQLGYSNGNISQCCNGKLKSAYKFKWKYA